MALWAASSDSSGGGERYPADLKSIIQPSVGEGTIIAKIGSWVDKDDNPVDSALPPLPPPELRGLSLPFANAPYLALSTDINRWLSNVRLKPMKLRGRLQIPGPIHRIGNPIMRSFIKKKILAPSRAGKRPRPPKTLVGKQIAEFVKGDDKKAFLDPVCLLSHPIEAVKQMASRLIRPHLGALVAGLCVSSGAKQERINAGYCVLSDPLLLAMCGCSDDIKLSIVEAAQEAHFSEIMKLVVLWRCALALDRKAATSFKVNGMARWCRPLSNLATEAEAALETDPESRNDFRVNIAPGNHLVSAAALDVLRLLPDTLVVWTSTHCDPAFKEFDKTTPSTYIPVVSDKPLVVDDASVMTFQQIRLILATREKVEFRGSKITGSFTNPFAPALPALVVQSYCYQKNKIVPGSAVYRDTEGMFIHPPDVPKRSIKMVEKKLVEMKGLEAVEIGKTMDTRPVYKMLKALCDYSTGSLTIRSSET